MKTENGGCVGPIVGTEVRALGNGKAIAIIKLEIIVAEGQQISRQSALAILDCAKERIASSKAEVKFDWHQKMLPIKGE